MVHVRFSQDLPDCCLKNSKGQHRHRETSKKIVEITQGKKAIHREKTEV